MKAILKEITDMHLKKELTEFRPGDTVKVYSKIKEGDKERLSAFEGIVLKRQGGGIGATFTVRRLVQGVGVERTFPLHSPKIERVKVVKKGKTRRAKLYYLRDRVGSAATRIEERVDSIAAAQ